LLISNRCDRRVLTFILIAAAGCTEGTGGTDGGAGDGGPAPAIVCPWGTFPSLTLPSGEVKGILKGMSRNASTTCTRQKGAGGPDTVFVLPVATRTTVELEVVSTIDTVLAIRTACDDPLSELACNDTPPVFTSNPGTGGLGGGAMPTPVPPPFGFDGGVAPPPPPGDGRDALLRATLNPGTYYVIVDEAEPFGVGGAFTLKVRSSTPVAHASCSAAKTLTDGLKLPAEEVDVGFEKPQSCSGAEPRPALFYTARVPSGQRLTVRAVPTNGDRQWSPVLQLLSGCTNGRCLARDTTSQFGDQQLRYVNNGSAAEDVILSVSPSTTVSGATYQLAVSIGEPVLNGTCGAARPLSDGLVLRNQDLSEGQISQGGMCSPGGAPALFYSVSLLPQQRLSVALSTDGLPGDPTFPGQQLLFMSLRSSCSGFDCRTGNMGGNLEYVNTSGTTEKLILEVSSFGGLPSLVFDMMVSMPLPPGSITVTPLGGLITSEAGDKATFEVVLGAPPTSAVTIPIESSAPTEGTVSPAMLLFGPENWNSPQKVTITGVDDNQRDGNHPYKILVKPASSTDPRYQDMDGDDVSVTNRDNEASFNFVGFQPLGTSESGSSVTFSAALNKKPTADVTLPLSSSDPGEGTVMPSSLTFTPANWDVPQYVTVTGVDDKDQDGAQAYKVVTGTVVTTDAEYSGLDPEDLAAVNADNEFVFIPAQAVSGGLPCSGGGFGRQIAADDANTIYVTMSCQGTGGAGGGVVMGGGTAGSAGSGGSTGSSSGRAPPSADAGVPSNPIGIPPLPASFGGLVVISTDGGKTFTNPRSLGLPQTFGDPQVVAGPAGTAYVVAQVPGNVMFTRTQDSGATWSSPRPLSGEAGNLRIAAAGKRVVIAGQGGSGSMVWSSTDGGQNFTETNLGSTGTILGLQVQTDGVIWLYLQEVVAALMKSTDGGVTFTSAGELPPDVFFDSIAFGSAAFFGTGKDSRLMVGSLAAPGTPRFVDGLPQSVRGPRSMIADRTDGVIVLDSSFDGTLQARRLSPGATTFSTARSLGSFAIGVSGVALSDKAAALAIWQNGQVLVTVQVWD
jgi:hypothetical protein